jgi:hypothetical protein
MALAAQARPELEGFAVSVSHQLLGDPGDVIGGDAICRVIGPEATDSVSLECAPSFSDADHLTGRIRAERPSALTAAARSDLCEMAPNLGHE